MSKFKLSPSDRIRLVIGAMGICLGAMEFISPTDPRELRWLKAWAHQVLGEQAYPSLLVLVGLAFVVSVLVRDRQGEAGG